MLENTIDFCIGYVPIQPNNIAMRTSIDVYMSKMFFLLKLAAQIACYSDTFHKVIIGTAT